MSSQVLYPADSGLRRLLFEGFELRLDSGELFQGGAPVKLQPQPAKVLEALASRAGEVVSREEIRQLVWGDAFVDFDASLNFCIKEIRRALGDSATSPRFVETVPRRGYRFLMPVRTDEEGPSPRPRSSRSWRRLGKAAAILSFLILLTLLLGIRLHHPTARGVTEELAEEPRPSNPAARKAYLAGFYLRGHGQYEQAEDTLENAVLLAPDFAPAYAELAKAKLERGLSTRADVDATEAAARRALELHPPGQGANEPFSGSSWTTNYRVILESAWKLGDRQAALGAAKTLMELHGLREEAAGLQRLEDYWRGQDQFLREMGRKGLMTPYDLARAAICVGEEERALDLLMEQCSLRSVQTPMIAVEPVFDSLHDNPRWNQVLDCLKLPADAPARHPRKI